VLDGRHLTTLNNSGPLVYAKITFWRSALPVIFTPVFSTVLSENALDAGEGGASISILQLLSGLR
jgi:hypothetical protein